MHVAGKCKMGISFWPMFSFQPPDRESQSGSIRLVAPADVPAGMLAVQPGDAAGTGTGEAGSNDGNSTAADSTAAVAEAPGSNGNGSGGGAGSAVAAVGESPFCRHLFHINFTQDPPDEVSIGAKFLGGIPFPFLSIRTTRLEVMRQSDCNSTVHALL